MRQSTAVDVCPRVLIKRGTVSLPGGSDTVVRPFPAIAAGVSGSLLVLVAACADQVVAPGDSASFARHSPRFQPLIAFERSGTKRGSQEIWVVDASGTQTKLSAKLDYAPVWSPAGSKLAFGSGRDGNSRSTS